MRLRAMIAHVLPANLLQGMDDDIVYFLHYSVLITKGKFANDNK